MSLHVGDQGGPWTDVATLGAHVNGRAGWLDSVYYRQRLVQIAGLYTWRNLGFPQAQQRIVRVGGAITGADRISINAQRRALNDLIATSTLREFWFTDTGSTTVARGHGHVSFTEIRPILRSTGRLGSFFTIEFRCADPLRYNITGGQPGIPLDPTPSALQTPSLTVIQQADSGLVVARSWNEASTSSLGADWTEDRGDWDIAQEPVSSEQRLRYRSNSAARNQILRYTGAAVSTPFVQQHVKILSLVSSSEIARIFGRYENGSYGSWPGTADCYELETGDNLLRLLEHAAGSGAVLDGPTGAVGKDGIMQLYLADDLQEGWRYTSDTVNATDASRNGVTTGFVALYGDVTLGGGPHSIWFKDTIIAKGRDIVVSGLTGFPGYKAKLLNGSDSVVAQATAVGDIATVNPSMFGSASEAFPITGQPALIVTDAADSEVARFSGAVWPGGSYAVS